MAELQVILPERANDEFSEAMRTLVGEIIARTDADGSYGLGGENGYSVDFETPVFIMRRFYWGDCDCGADERLEEWHAANPHADDCFQVELARRHADYDESSGYNALNAATSVSDRMETKEENVTVDVGVQKLTFVSISSWRTLKGEAAHKAWSKAYDKRGKAHDKITRQFYVERGMKPERSVWCCTCGTHERAMVADTGHRPECALELPNFEYKPTGFKAEWYKWIGRDNKLSGDPPPIAEILAACIASLPSAPSPDPKP